MKNDFKDGKLRWDLLPLKEIEDTVKVYTFGAQKYSENSWQKLQNGYERYRAALLRHMTAIENGELFDSESGLLHTAHIMWNSIALNYFLKKGDKVIYKDIPGYEKYYYADIFGNIYSKDRFHNTTAGGFVQEGRKLKPSLNNKGYLNVCFSIDGASTTHKVHQLIAKTFIPNPHGYSEINHKNENKTDNSVFNLEWCSRTYNMNYGTIHEKLSQRSKSRDRARPVEKLSPNGVILDSYAAVNDVVKDGYDPSFIAKVCSGKKKSAYGFMWRYAKEGKQ